MTDAFPVSITGFTQLTQALTDIAALITHIHSHPNTDIPADMLPRGSATANRYLRFNGGLLAGKPQATVGLSLAALGTLFQDIATNPGGGAAAPTAAQELFGGGLDPSGFGTSVGGTAATTGLARVGAARAAAHAEIVASLPHSEQSVEMEALMAHLILYLDQGEQGVAGYGKTIAGGLMMRTAFDTVYQQIPPVGRVTTDKHPDLFALMVCRAARRVNANINDDGDVFSGGIYNDNLKYGPASAEPKTSAQRAALTGHLRRRDWLEGIASGVDKLTRVNFPSQRLRHTSEIESLGSYGVTTDTMGAIHLPILEFRGLPQIQAGIFPLMAMDIFRYVFALNTAAGTGNPGDLQAVGINSRTALLNPSDPNYALELANAVTAAAHAVAGWRGTTGG